MTANITETALKVLISVESQNGRMGPVNAKDIDDEFASIRGQGEKYINDLLELGLIEETQSPLPAGNDKFYKTTESGKSLATA